MAQSQLASSFRFSPATHPDADSADERRVVGDRQASQGRLVVRVRLLPRPQRFTAGEAPLRRLHSAAGCRYHKTFFFPS